MKEKGTWFLTSHERVRNDMSDTVSKPTFSLLSFVSFLTALSLAGALAAYAYLGFFSRHLADDYCSANLIRGNFLINLWDNYQTVSDRFANFVMIALSESLWPGSVAILPALMLTLWVAGIVWFLWEAGRLIGKSPAGTIIFSIALMVVFFTILQVPNRFQTLYWRASIAAHLTPLVLIPYLASFILHTIHSAARKPPGWWVYPLGFCLAFVIGDFSEPTDAVLVVLLACSFLVVWVGYKNTHRKIILQILGWTMAGALSALLVMAISPANSLRLGSPPPAFPVLVARSFSYVYEFVVDSLRIRPLPAFLSALMPFLLFYGMYAQPVDLLAPSQQHRILMTLILTPFLTYLLIVASFAPSVYGQGFPIERTRLAGVFLFVATLMIEGAGLGIVMAQWRPRLLDRVYPGVISILILGLTALYPLRNGWLTLAEAPAYRDRAAAWDERQAYIQKLIANGETNLLIPQFDGIYGIKELDVNSDHWSNRCAAIYYNVNSIRAIPPDGP